MSSIRDRLAQFLLAAATVLTWTHHAAAQGTQAGSAHQNTLDNYFNIATGQKAVDFRPLQFPERRKLFFQNLTNPFSLAQPLASAGLDHLHDKPEEWEQGATGYAKRFGNIMGQSLTRRSVEFATSSLLHEDNRYFGSGQHGVWRRTRYAIVSSVTARHDNGRRYPSISGIVGVTAGASIARLWLPASQSSAGDAAASVGYTMAGHAAASIFKEFLPDILHIFIKNRPATRDPVVPPSRP